MLDDVIALGDDVRPATLFAAYRHGCFPWPAPGWPSIPWCSPLARAVLPAADPHVSRSLRTTLRQSGWTTTVDVAFDDVVRRCAARPSTWITSAMASGYSALHRAAHAHSVEVWEDDRLIGGLYGVLTGGVFSGESMFHRVSDASKVALVDLAARFAAAGGALLDCQQPTDHLRRMGAVVLPRPEYLHLLRGLRDQPVTLDRERLPVARLAATGVGEEPAP
ncbi:MAG: leucyl/phenylalanyl-tRNA--protein transferase [Frankiaceae bacterium]